LKVPRPQLGVFTKLSATKFGTPIGRNLDEEGLQFLASFAISHQELQDEYAAIQKDLERMREGLPPSMPLPFATTQFADESSTWRWC
jgi:hypothetical protein